MDDSETFEHVNQVAIVGMSGRFPGAGNTDELWENLCAGRECISFFSREELEASGIDRALLDDPNYVPAKGVVEGADTFDASFFGYSPREAEIMDPQQRLFLECAWEALEQAGYDPEQYAGRIGVYGGVGLDAYLIQNLLPNRAYIESVGDLQYIAHGNDKDYVTTRVSYKLGLSGPSVNIQSACSTSLVAICIAYQSLLSGECDMALAGGAFINTPLKAGYLYRVGSIVSPDGHCRPFDAKAGGTVFGDGVGLVVLKRLADALADGDTIYAVIKGTALNNDGSAKVSYTAPSVQRQAEVIAEAMAIAEVDPETIGYVETHGTGTLLGDPIEMTALTQAFHTGTGARGFCAIGSAKSALGHLDAAAGVASLIKTSLALQHKVLPPSLNFEAPNPQIDFANSPFYVNVKAAEWRANGGPRRAGVSSFGVGGTNAHVILEEAPPVEHSGPSRPCQVLMLSAKTERALDAATERLARHLEAHREANLADVAHTLQVGRKRFDHRRTVVCHDVDEAIAALRTRPSKGVITGVRAPGYRPVAFMFSGQGAQYANMGLGLYESEPIFREAIDRCAEILQPLLGLDLREIMYPAADPDRVAEADQLLQQTAITQPAIFTIEYALARLWIEWGIEPQAVTGHSIGEYAAACIAGVFSLEDGLALAAERGRLMQALPGGTMLIVNLPEEEVQPYLSEEVSLAVINSPDLCVLAGPMEAIAAVQERLTERGCTCRPLHTSHAFHSAMMEPMLEAFAERVRRVDLRPPRIPYVSNLTADWATSELTDPEYWVRHVRQTVRFAQGVQRLFEEPEQILLEVGPGRTLSTLARRHPERAAGQCVLDSLRHPQDEQPDPAYLLGALGRLWVEGVRVDWAGFYAHERRRRLALPTYPFERKRFWVEEWRDTPQSYDELNAPQRMKAPTPPGRGLEQFQNSPDAPVLGARAFSEEHFQNSGGGNGEGQGEVGSTYEGGPRDEVERKVARIWESVLGVEQVKVTDDFFDLGGHSMLLASLAVQVKKAFGRDLPLRAFFQAPMLEELANLLREDGAAGSQPPIRLGHPLEAPPPQQVTPVLEPVLAGSERARPQDRRARKKGLVHALLRIWRNRASPDPIQDTLLAGLKNRFLQQIAGWIAGATTVRVWLHRARGVQIGEDVFIGYQVVLESAYPRLISIGSNVFISVRTIMIGHFMGSAKRARAQGEPSVRIEDDVSIGPNVVILPNVTIGRGSVVAAGSVVTASVPPLTMVQGNPARAVARCGIPLMGNPYEKFINSLTLLDGEGNA